MRQPGGRSVGQREQRALATPETLEPFVLQLGKGGTEESCRAGSLTQTCCRPHEAEMSRVSQVDILLTLDTEKRLAFRA
jgi:hypothetical protein